MQFGGLLFELLDRQPAHQRGIVEEAVFVGAEEIARHSPAGGRIGLGANEAAELGVERNGGLGQETPHRVGLDVGIGLDLAPHGELRRVIGAEGEGGHHLEPDLSRAVSVEQFGRQLAEAQALPDMAFGGAEPNGNRLDHLAGVDQGRHRDKFVRRMHRRADRVFDQRGLPRRFGLFDQARHLEAGRERAFGGEFLQHLEAPAAGSDGVHVLGVAHRMNDEVLL